MLSKMTTIHNHLTPEVLRRCMKSRLFGSERRHYKDKSMFDIAQLCFNDKFTEKVRNMYKLEQVNETSFYVLRHVDYYGQKYEPVALFTVTDDDVTYDLFHHRMRVVTVKISDNLAYRLYSFAEENHVSVSSVIRYAIKRYLNER